MPFDATPQFDLDALCERDEVLRVINQADALLKTKHDWFGPIEWRELGGRYCLGTAGLWDIRGWADAYLCEHFPKGSYGLCGDNPMPHISSWNNTSGRTFPQVKQLLADMRSARIEELRAKAITARARLVQGGAG